jgi:hypothetical protein
MRIGGGHFQPSFFTYHLSFFMDCYHNQVSQCISVPLSPNRLLWCLTACIAALQLALLPHSLHCCLTACIAASQLALLPHSLHGLEGNLEGVGPPLSPGSPHLPPHALGTPSPALGGGKQLPRSTAVPGRLVTSHRGAGVAVTLAG